MFATRLNPCPRLPSFSELMLSIAHHPQFPQQQHLVLTAPLAVTLQPQPTHYMLVPVAPDSLQSALSPLDYLLPRLISSRSYDLPSPPASTESVEPLLRSSESESPEIVDSPVSSSTSKRKHACKTCGRSFTTLGHLARHNRTHTGERKHMCPWPQCEARFARQDNCMQHYKTHMNGKSKRNRLRR